MSNLTPHLTIPRREYCATDLHHHAIAGSGLFVRRPCILSWSMECHGWCGAAQVHTMMRVDFIESQAGHQLFRGCIKLLARGR